MLRALKLRFLNNLDLTLEKKKVENTICWEFKCNFGFQKKVDMMTVEYS